MYLVKITTTKYPPLIINLALVSQAQKEEHITEVYFAGEEKPTIYFDELGEKVWEALENQTRPNEKRIWGM